MNLDERLNFRAKYTKYSLLLREGDLLQKTLKLIVSLPLLKTYTRLIKYLSKRIRIQLIGRINLIYAKPTNNFINLCKQQPCYLYLPWIEALTNKLLEQLNHSATPHFSILPLPIFADTKTIKARKKIIFFAQYHQQTLERILLNWLQPVAADIAGVVFTFDYGLLQRQVIRVCQQLNIQTILIPHESVFFNRDKYYLHPVTGINTPLCDYVLCWGQLQKDIFTNRGYPLERVQIVGAPKLDRYYHYQPRLSRNEFCKRANFNENKAIILFAAQTLDFQVNHRIALHAQRSIITQLIDYCLQKNCEFVLRCPPTGYLIGDKKFFAQMQETSVLVDAPSPNYCFEPEEAIYHADIIVSINSTMLFEALLMGKRALSVKYFDFVEDWQQAGIKCVFKQEELTSILDTWLEDKKFTKPKPTNWAIKSFSLNGFDGQATNRIIHFLDKIIASPIKPISLATKRILHDEGPPIDFAYFPKEENQFSSITELLNIKNLITFNKRRFIPWAEVVCSVQQETQSLPSAVKHLPKIYIAPGLISYGEKWTSIIVDDIAFYDATNQPTRLRDFLNSNLKLTKSQEEEAQNCINKLIANGLLSLSKSVVKQAIITQNGRPKILLIDEYVENSDEIKKIAFNKVIEQAIQFHPDYDILIKAPHPLKKGKTYLNRATLNTYLKQNNNIYFINSDYDLYTLIRQVDKLYVVNSVIGFWGLLLNKEVCCYGLPFYAGWGLTKDDNYFSLPLRKRTFTELFYFVCIYLSRYYSPLLQRKCSLSEYIEYILAELENSKKIIVNN
ncbi:hypothetical protein ACNVED_09790 [Legionella sp. D16C41]|uniref:capsular polysaccharide export protein, LipB/KpsS family n=1 Tax=Legionella sp. D16C41 TaxID=3402688 RepID=UPI003AF5AC07